VAYSSDTKVRDGARANNYEAYSCVAEWLRYRAELVDNRHWIGRDLRRSMVWLTAHGLYRDPGDPCLYDLAVRHNLSELLEYGYDGALAGEVDELLRRGGLTMLLMLSPNGWAPYGGRSNLFVHNEAMVAYVAEFEARRWNRRGNDRIAGAFKRAGRQAALVAKPYFCDARPLCYLKNRFPASTKHGRDTNYGEYAVYSLLAASLFARTYLIADDSIAEGVTPVGAQSTLLHLYPEFHRTFASCDDTQVEIDTAGQPGYDATGLGRFHRRGVPVALGLSMSLAADPRYISAAGSTDRAAAIGPRWRCPDGRWCTLAACSKEIANVHCRTLEIEDHCVRFMLTYELPSVCAQEIEQTFTLRAGRLDMDFVVKGEIDRVALEVPCLSFDGQEEAELETDAASAQVRYQGHGLSIDVPAADRVEVDPEPQANRQAVYRLVTFEAPGAQLSATLRLE